MLFGFLLSIMLAASLAAGAGFGVVLGSRARSNTDSNLTAEDTSAAADGPDASGCEEELDFGMLVDGDEGSIDSGEALERLLAPFDNADALPARGLVEQPPEAEGEDAS